MRKDAAPNRYSANISVPPFPPSRLTRASFLQRKSKVREHVIDTCPVCIKQYISVSDQKQETEHFKEKRKKKCKSKKGCIQRLDREKKGAGCSGSIIKVKT